MFIRTQKTTTQLIDGKLPQQIAARPILYPTAYPFDRCNQGGANGPGSVAYVALHGRNGAVSTSLTDIWEQGGVRTLPTAGFTFGVSSSSASDTALGTGARSVEVDVIELTTYKLYTFPVDLAGQTKVVDTNLVGTCFRINDIRIKAWGSGLANAGDIYVYDSSDTVSAGVPQTAAKIFAKIVAGANIARNGFYTVPAGCKMQSQQFRGGFNDTTTTARAATVQIKTAFPSASGPAVFTLPLVGQLNNAGSPYSNIDPDFTVSFDEKTDISLQAIASASVAIVGFLDMILYYK